MSKTEGITDMNPLKMIILSVTGGILSGLAWTSWFSGLILLAAFVPFFLIENHIFDKREKYRANSYFIYLLPGVLIFNSIAVGWVRAASIPAMITVITGMSFLMAFTLWLAHLIRIKAGTVSASIAVVSLWMAFEFLTLRTPLLSPWVNLGNGLAKDILFIQWYELTGTGGGSLWILISNLMLTAFIVNLLTQDRKRWIFLRIWIIVIIIPSIISVARYFTVKPDDPGSYEVLIVQPNIDPFTEKFTLPFSDQLEKTLLLAEGSITENTRWLLTPETTIDDPVNEELTEDNPYIAELMEFAGKNRQLAIVAGLVSYRLYPPGDEPPSNSARRIDSTGLWYDHFNSAFLIDSAGVKGIYHKSKLVAGIEMQLSSLAGSFINRVIPYLGGTLWGYGTQRERTCFEHPQVKQTAAPVICYESVYGDHVADYIRKGAGALFIITNDGWWKNTSGYRQHLSYASLRAIETRRMVARAANTGISCIIDNRGKITARTTWWTEAVLRGKISAGSSLTPYVRHGDWLMRLSSLISILILAYVFIALPVRKKFHEFH